MRRIVALVSVEIGVCHVIITVGPFTAAGEAVLSVIVDVGARVTGVKRTLILAVSSGAIGSHGVPFGWLLITTVNQVRGGLSSATRPMEKESSDVLNVTRLIPPA